MSDTVWFVMQRGAGSDTFQPTCYHQDNEPSEMTTEGKTRTFKRPPVKVDERHHKYALVHLQNIYDHDDVLDTELKEWTALWAVADNYTVDGMMLTDFKGTPTQARNNEYVKLLVSASYEEESGNALDATDDMDVVMVVAKLNQIHSDWRA
jgi:hypothetical protein